MKIARTAARIGHLFGRTPGVLATVHGIALASLVAATWAPAAHAIPVLSTVSNVAVPLTSAGIYINVVTGAFGTAPASAPGWDLNPWGTTAFRLWNPTGDGSGFVTSPNSTLAALTAGTVVGSASSFASNTAATFGALAGQWTANATNYFGFSFVGEDAALHYGWGTAIIGATFATRTIGQLWYESVAGASITIPAIPEPASAGLLLAGGALGALVLRRRRAAMH
jgi:hypothetical protein